MDKENVAYMHNGVIVIHKEKVDRPGYHIK